MTQHNNLNVKLSNSQLNKLKSAIKNETEVALILSSNLIGSSNDKTNFLHQLLLANTQVLKICKAFTNGSSANIKVSKTRLSKIVLSGGFIFGPLNILASSNASDLLNAPCKGFFSLENSIAKETNNMGAKN